MPRPSTRVEAAGGVVWRRSDRGDRPDRGDVEVAVVHRPRYDDWSLPKGKLEDGEHPLACAVREVGEETGSRVVVGARVGQSRYPVDQGGRAVTKRVTWWSMEHVGGEFAPDDEVDALRWCDPQTAEHLLTAGRDLAPLRAALAQVDDVTVLLVRHGSAGSRARWKGPDEDRPLDARGRAQADALVALLAPYAPQQVVSAPPLRCRQTVEPLAERLDLPIGLEPLLGENGFEPEGSLERLRALAAASGSRGALVVASQGGAAPDLVRALAEAPGAPTVRDPRVRKAGTWVLSLRDGALRSAHLEPPPA